MEEAETAIAEAGANAPRTHAEQSRERRDLASGAVMDEARLIRFALSPDGVVVPDLGRRLPGRGMWVEATRAAVDIAVKRQAFSRSAKMRAIAPGDLSDQVERLLLARLSQGLGLARRAGQLVLGFDKVDALVRSGRCGVLIEATDGAADGRRKLSQAAHAASLIHGRAPVLAAIFTSEELNLALGLGNVIHLGLHAGHGAENWASDLARLAGFRPLVPPSWSEAV